MFLHEIIFMRILLDFYVNIEEVHKLFDYLITRKNHISKFLENLKDFINFLFILQFY